MNNVFHCGENWMKSAKTRRGNIRKLHKYLLFSSFKNSCDRSWANIYIFNNNLKVLKNKRKARIKKNDKQTKNREKEKRNQIYAAHCFWIF